VENIIDIIIVNSSCCCSSISSSNISSANKNAKIKGAERIS